MNPETKFRKRVKPIIDKLPNTFGFSIQQLAIVGTPDTYYCINGWCVVPEFKASAKAKKHPLQIYNIRRINESGGFGFFLFPENWQDAYEFLKLLSSEKGKAYAADDLRALARPLLLPGTNKARACDDD